MLCYVDIILPILHSPKNISKIRNIVTQLHSHSKSLIAGALVLVYDMIEKITYVTVLICSILQIKN